MRTNSHHPTMGGPHLAPLPTAAIRALLILFLMFLQLGGRDDLLGQPAVASETQWSADSLYDPERLLDVRITLPEDDWRRMRTQLKRSRVFPEEGYTYFEADVEIDGVKIERVGVRKKGNAGSVNSMRPSLKVSFDQFEADQRFLGIKDLTLNNNNQDPSSINTLITYELFRSAGHPAPRVSFARVTVNGEDLGVYSNVEPIKKPFLKRHFSSAKGNLYEGPGDLLGRQVDRLSRKNNEDDPDRSDLDAVVAALQSPDSELVEALEKVIDLDNFLTFWALEVLIGHWDGYASNRNNFYVYSDPSDGRFRFIPWGADDVMTEPGPFFLDEVPRSVKARGALCHRLYNLPEVRTRYRERMRELLKSVWNEEEIIARIDRACAVFEDSLTVDRNVFHSRIARAKHFVTTRRAQLEAELVGEAPEWPEPGPGRTRGRLSGTFSGVWNERISEGPVEPGGATLELVINGNPLQLTDVRALLGNEVLSIRPGFPHVILVGYDPEEKRWITACIPIDPLMPGPTYNVNVWSSLAYLGELPGDEHGPQLNWMASEMKKLGWIFGRLEMNQDGYQPGDRVTGQFQGFLR